MDKTFSIYVVFGEYRTDYDGGRQYTKVPLSVQLSLAQAQFEWQQFEKWREWLPEGATYLNCYVSSRTMKLYE